jgi:histone-lysine N-methyltransferase SETMAR
VTPDNINRVKDILEQDRRVSVADISETLNISYGSVRHILVEDLQLSKLCARWIPRLLTPLQKEVRVAVAKANIRMADNNPNFYDRLITTDETWIHYYEPESKEQSKQWLPRGSNPPLKAKTTSSFGKVMATVFWDGSGVILIDYLQKGASINSAYYANLLEHDLREALRKKRPGKLKSVPLLLHDNASSHTAKHTQDILQRMKWEILMHPPYSPDLAPSDFHLFPHLKKHLRGHHFETEDELKKAVQTWVKSQSPDFYARGFEKLLDRYYKCINLGGDYVEKCSLDDNDD